MFNKAMFRIKQNFLKVDSFFWLSLVVLFITFYNFFNTWIIESDSLYYYSMSLNKDFFYLIYGFIKEVFLQGRINFLGFFWYRVTFFIDNFYYFKFIFYLLLLSNCILLSLLVSKILKEKKIFYMIFLIFLIFLQNTWHANGLVGFSNMFLGMVALFLLSLIFFKNYIDFGGKKNLFLSVILFFILLFSYEIFLIYIPVFLFLYLTKKRTISFKIFLPFVFIIILYLLTYLVVRHLSLNVYAGVDVDFKSINLLAILKVIFQFSIAALPLYMLKYDIWSKNLGVFNLSIVDYFFDVSFFLWFIKAIALFILMYKILNSILLRIKPIVLTFLVITLTYFFLSPLLLALTKHYQDIVINKIFLSEPITYFSFIFLVCFVSILILLFYSFLKNKKVKRIYKIFVCVVFSLVGLLMDYSNFSYSLSQKKVKERWDTVNNYILSDDFNYVSDNSTLLSRNLYRSYFTLVINDPNYWDKYIYLKTGKTVKVVDEIDSSSTFSIKNKTDYFLY